MTATENPIRVADGVSLGRRGIVVERSRAVRSAKHQESLAAIVDPFATMPAAEPAV